MIIEATPCATCGESHMYTEAEVHEMIHTIRRLRTALADMDHEWLSRLVHEAGLSDELGRMNAIERVAGIARAALTESERWEAQ